MNKRLFDIFIVFLKMGLILLGGGFVVVPIMQEELINKRKWLTNKELIDFYSVSQCLCGIIAINMTILTSYKIAKLKGVFVALIAMNIPAVSIILLLSHFISQTTNLPFMRSFFYGANLAVLVLIYLTFNEMKEYSFQDKLNYIWFFFILFLFMTKINPVFLIILSIVFGAILPILKRYVQNE